MREDLSMTLAGLKLQGCGGEGELSRQMVVTEKECGVTKYFQLVVIRKRACGGGALSIQL